MAILALFSDNNYRSSMYLFRMAGGCCSALQWGSWRTWWKRKPGDNHGTALSHNGTCYLGVLTERHSSLGHGIVGAETEYDSYWPYIRHQLRVQMWQCGFVWPSPLYFLKPSHFRAIQVRPDDGLLEIGETFGQQHQSGGAIGGGHVGQT